MRRVLFGIALIFGAWALLHYSGAASAQILPSPVVTLRRLSELVSSGALNQDLLASGKRWIYGFCIGVLIGAPVGLAMGYFRWVGMALDFPIDFVRSLPVSALFPLYLLVFGIEDRSKVAMIATAVACVMVVVANYGVRQAPVARQMMAKAFGATTPQKLWNVILPEAVGQIVAGMRVSLGTSLVVLILAEMLIGSRFGLGQRLYDAYSINAAPDMYAVVLVVGSIGYALNVGFQHLEKRFVFWIGQ